jgi:hypothetical protein
MVAAGPSEISLQDVSLHLGLEAAANRLDRDRNIDLR